MKNIEKARSIYKGRGVVCTVSMASNGEGRKGGGVEEVVLHRREKDPA